MVEHGAKRAHESGVSVDKQTPETPRSRGTTAFAAFPEPGFPRHICKPEKKQEKSGRKKRV